MSDLSHKVVLMRICSDCGTSKTPLWRGGPSGPKSLCNACGIRNRKMKRRALLGHQIKKSKSSEESKLILMHSSNSNYSYLGEIEQAALLLMALSSPSLFA